MLGAIATSSVLNACFTSTQNQAQVPSPAATDTAMQGMDHNNMGGMNQGSMAMDLGPADAEIVRAQDKEINQMKQWRQALYPKASAPVASQKWGTPCRCLKIR